MDRLSNILTSRSRDVVTIAPTASLYDAVELMNVHEIGSIVVVCENHPIGILTERDVLLRVVGARRDPDTTRVAEVMTFELVTVAPTTTVPEAMSIMTRLRTRHLPVIVDRVAVGMISQGDLTHWIIRDSKAYIEDLVFYISHA